MASVKMKSDGFRVSLRGLDTFVRTWGDESAPPLVMLHGGQDASATFQFVVDCFRKPWRVFAPDWRGHGKTAWAPQGYAFHEYLADLDALLTYLFPQTPAAVVGHSLGGNVVSIYSGVRPDRIARFVSLDGFGLPDRKPEEAPAQLQKWLVSWREPVRVHKQYSTLDEMAARLQASNPRLETWKAVFLAGELSTKTGDGTYVWSFDPRHRGPFATLFRHAEFAACLAQGQAPALFIGSGSPFPPSLAKTPGGVQARAHLYPGAMFDRVADTGHNLHHDNPAAVASLIEDFMSYNNLRTPERSQI